MSSTDMLDLLLIAGLVSTGAYLLWTNGSLQTPSTAEVLPSRKFREGGVSSRMQNEGKRVLLVFGSQTGTAESYANRFAAQITKSFRLGSITISADDFTVEDMAEFPAEWLLVFFVATYGIGEPTDNMVSLFASLEGLQSDQQIFNKLHYAVFGLGNRTYSDFNGASKKLEKLLSQGGASLVGKRGEGDDDGMMEEDYVAWCDDMWPCITSHLGIVFDPSSLETPFVSNFEIEFLSPRQFKPAKLFSGEIGHIGANGGEKRSIYDAKHPYYAKISKAYDLVNSMEAKSTLHIELDISESGLKYQHGDHLGIFPQNSPQAVQRMLNLLGFDGDEIVSIKIKPEDASKLPFPSPAPLRAVLTSYLDLSQVVKRSVLRVLKTYITDKSEESLFVKIADNVAVYEEVVRRNNSNIIDILEQYRSIKIPTAILLEVLPRIQCRYYSISSSQKAHPDSIHVTVSVLRYHVHNNKLVEGLCTAYLHRLATDDDYRKDHRIGIYVRRSKFKLPRNRDSTLPVICIGPGSGVAPFRSFISERGALLKKNKKVGDTHLFFGCQHAERDFLYSDEWPQLLEEKSLTTLHTAFSRDQPTKEYVQHKLWETRDWIYDLIANKNAWIYICGDGKYMSKDVNATLLSIFETCGGMTSEDSIHFMELLTKNGRYHEDVWG